jgi:hypothetical protein
MSREVMKQALQHLVDLADDLRRIPSDIAQTIAALEAEIAKPEQKIIGWINGEPQYAKPEQKPVSTNDHLCAMLRQVHDVLACTALPMKRQWVGLTDDEIKEVLDLNVAPWSLSGVALQHVMDDARALEAKLKEKNGG